MTACLLAALMMTPYANSNGYIPPVEPIVEEHAPIMVVELAVVEEIIEKPTEPEYPLTMEEMELIALVTMAEAEGECEEGKRLVIDTILNRKDSSKWPNTVEGVIYQKSQFTSMWNGRVDRCYVRDDILQLVKEETLSRSNHDVVFFRTGHYSQYGTPAFKVGNHYFSSL